MSVHLVEVSDVMRRLQEAALCPGEASEQRLRDVSGDSNAFHQRKESKAGPPVSWYSSPRDPIQCCCDTIDLPDNCLK